jgi:hypothetical protein
MQVSNNLSPNTPPNARPLSSFNYWARNYNKGDIPRIKASLRRFGYVRQIVVWREGIVAAGNGTLRALRELKAEYDRSGESPPPNVYAHEGDWWIVATDASHLSTLAEAEAYAIADNATAAHAEVDQEALADLLEELSAHADKTLVQATGYDADEIEQLLAQIAQSAADAATDPDPAGSAPVSDGSLLALTNVTLDEPLHKVEAGDVWLLGQHRLICAPVITDHAAWLPYLQQDETALFAPYAGPFVALSQRAEQQPFIIVQPDPYVAGHIIDRYVEIKGDADVRRAD